MKLDTQRLQTLDQVREFLAGSRPLDLQPQTRAEAYAFVAETLQRFDYSRQGKADKGLIRRFLNKVTGLSRAQVTRLLHQHRTTGAIADRRRPRHPFPRRYTKGDIGLLAEVDALHGTPLRSGHPQALRPGLAAVRRPPLRAPRRHLQRTPLQPAPLDQLSTPPRDDARADPPRAHRHRRAAPAPSPSDNPATCGSIRSTKETSTASRASTTSTSSTRSPSSSSSARSSASTRPASPPVLEALLRAFPFNVRGFHTDNGSEFINHKIVARLQALHIDEFTKSRPRRSNDNALVESKNGSVIRKHLGYGHIPSRYAERVNAFTQQILSPYPNFHRPCLFPVDEVDAKGRVRKRYPHANVMTPYEKLKSLPTVSIR